MKTMKIEIDGEKWIAVREADYATLAQNDGPLLAPPPRDHRGRRNALAGIRTTMANQIILWRRAAKINQADLADLAKVSRDTISRIERGVIEGLKTSTMDKICAALESRLPFAEFQRCTSVDQVINDD